MMIDQENYLVELIKKPTALERARKFEAVFDALIYPAIITFILAIAGLVLLAAGALALKMLFE